MAITFDKNSEAQARSLMGDPPAGALRLTVRVEKIGSPIFHEVVTLLTPGEFDQRPAADLVTDYALPAIAMMQAERAGSGLREDRRKV